MSGTITELKIQLRAEMKAFVAGLPEGYCKAADAEILRRVVTLPEYQQADTIFCFVGTSSEIDTVPILMDAWKKGKQVCVPRCVGKGIMNAYRIDGLDELEEGSYGILEPSAAAEIVLPEEIGLALVPCLSCSSDGRRLGYGGGYYDRYLGKVAAPKAVLCRSRVMREEIPVDGYDLRMGIVVCEDGVRCSF